MAAVASTSDTFRHRPASNSLSELLHYILTNEITAAYCWYSGILQIQFLAGAIAISIQQHIECHTSVADLGGDPRVPWNPPLRQNNNNNKL